MQMWRATTAVTFSGGAEPARVLAIGSVAKPSRLLTLFPHSLYHRQEASPPKSKLGIPAHVVLSPICSHPFPCDTDSMGH